MGYLSRLWTWIGDEINARALGVLLVGLPAAFAGITYVTTTLFPAPVDVISIKATDFRRVQNVNTFEDKNCQERPFGNQSPGDQILHNEAEYLITVPAAGKYQLSVEYAQAKAEGNPRLVKVTLNGSVLKDAFNGFTADWCPERSRWDSLGDVDLHAGRNTLLLSREGPFPHLKTIRLVRS